MPFTECLGWQKHKKAEMVKSHVFTGHEGIPFFNEEFNLQHKINFVIQIVFTFG